MNRKAMQSIFFSVVVGLLFVFVSAAAAQPMKIAVPATGSKKMLLSAKKPVERLFFSFLTKRESSWKQRQIHFWVMLVVSAVWLFRCWLTIRSI